MRLEEEGSRQASTIGEQSESLSALQAKNTNLTLRRDQLSAENYTLLEKIRVAETTINTQNQSLTVAQENLSATQLQLSKTQQILAVTQADLSGLRSTQERLEQQLASLNSRFSTQATDLLRAQAEERRTERSLQTLQGDFTELKVKYDRLVRPARSPAGHFVVEIRYTKIDKAFKIEYKTEEKPDYITVNQSTLEQQLDHLKAQKKSGLYIKLIFSENSGLSFNEAWGITSHLHGKYDYYHSNPVELVPTAPLTPAIR